MLDFNQPPYTEVLMPDELLDRYGEGVIFASGLIVEAETVFGDLWKACDTFYGRGEKIFATDDDVKLFLNDFNEAKKENFLDKPLSEYITATNKQYNKWINLYQNMGYSEDFAESLMDNDLEIPSTEYKKYLDSKIDVPNVFKKRDIIRRINKFSDRYFDGDKDLTIRALKHVQLYHDWCDITKTYVPIDWSKVKWKNVLIDADTTAASGCSGGACEITSI